MTQALRPALRQAGSSLIITMAPQTIDMQSTSNAYFQKTALNIKDILMVVNMQYYNSGSMLGCDGKVYSQGSVDFLTALACIQLQAAWPPPRQRPRLDERRGQRLCLSHGGEQRVGLPGQRHQLRFLQALQNLPGPARRDDLVDGLGRVGGQRVVELGGGARARARLTRLSPVP